MGMGDGVRVTPTNDSEMVAAVRQLTFNLIIQTLLILYTDYYNPYYSHFQLIFLVKNILLFNLL